MKVYVDDNECLNYTFDADKESDKEFFNIKTGHMGLGLWMVQSVSRTYM